MLLTKADEKTNTVITINTSGIWYQELLTSDRPQSPRVKLGKLALVEGEIMSDFTEWDEYNTLIVLRRVKESTIKVIKDRILDYYKVMGIDSKEVIGDRSVDGYYKDLAKVHHPDKEGGNSDRMKQINDARDQLVALHSQHLELMTEIDFYSIAIEEDPIHKLSTLSGKIYERVNKLINASSFKHQFKETARGIVFQPLQTLDHFMESQAKDLVKRTNEHLEKMEITTGYLDIETAREIIAKRFDRAAKRLAELHC